MSQDASWKPIETAPQDEDILVYTKPWGAIIVRYSSEFGEWLSRMQVPVSIREDGEKPTHWLALPGSPDGDGDGVPPAT